MISDTPERRSQVPKEVPPNLRILIMNFLPLKKTMDLHSLNDAINNFSDKERLIQAVQENQAKLEIQGMITSLLDNHCFDQCIKSSKSLTGSEKGIIDTFKDTDCLSNCASRFLDVNYMISEHFNKS